MALPTQQCSTVGVLIDLRNIELGQVNASELVRAVRARGVAIAAEGPLEGLSRKVRPRAQEVFRFRIVAHLTIERRVV